MNEKQPANDIGEGQVEQSPPHVEISYIKCSQFRVIYVSGAYGGISPEGTIHAAIYNQRHPIPQKTVHEVQDGRLVEIREGREGKTGIVRQVEADLVMDLGAAEVFRDWLDQKIKDLKKMLSQQKQHTQTEPTHESP